jgi:tetratricopeptide (TPR) repeat protein
MSAPFDFDIHRRLTAASGFCELGLYQEALEELTGLPDTVKGEVAVLAAWLQIYQSWGKWAEEASVAERLIEKNPEEADWYVALAFATRRGRGLAEAEAVLADAVERFPENATINFNLACYYAQLGELELARLHLGKAIAIDSQFKAAALADPDLEPLRRGG